MIAAFLLLGLVTIAGAALAGWSSNQALRHHSDQIGGDFGSPDVAGRDAELRTLIAAGDARLAHRRRHY